MITNTSMMYTYVLDWSGWVIRAFLQNAKTGTAACTSCLLHAPFLSLPLTSFEALSRKGALSHRAVWYLYSRKS